MAIFKIVNTYKVIAGSQKEAFEKLTQYESSRVYNSLYTHTKEVNHIDTECEEGIII